MTINELQALVESLRNDNFESHQQLQKLEEESTCQAKQIEECNTLNASLDHEVQRLQDSIKWCERETTSKSCEIDFLKKQVETQEEKVAILQRQTKSDERTISLMKERDDPVRFRKLDDEKQNLMKTELRTSRTAFYSNLSLGRESEIKGGQSSHE